MLRFLLLFLFFNITSLFGQDTTAVLLQKMANKIFIRLGGKGACPTIKIGPNNDIASIRNNIIVISDVLVINKLKEKYKNNPELLDDALAIIIGHELWHYIKGERIGGIGCVGQHGEHTHSEYEADLHGLFGALLFGEYTEAEKVMAEVYDLILPDKPVHCYPDLSTRKQTYEFLKKRVRIALQFFDLGASFLLRQKDAEDFQISRACYQVVAKDLAEIPDVQYNLGMTYLLEALVKSDFLYVLPAEINSGDFAKSILRGPKDRDNNGDNVKDLLDEAKSHFDRAYAQQDGKHYDAAIANYCIQTIIDTNGENANKLKEWLDNSTGFGVEHIRKMKLLYAISLLRGSKSNQSLYSTAINQLKELQKGSDVTALFAGINLKKLEKSPHKQDTPPTSIVDWDTRQDNVNLNKFIDRTDWAPTDFNLKYMLDQHNKIEAITYGRSKVFGVQKLSQYERIPARKGIYQSGAGTYGHLSGKKSDTTACDFFFTVNEAMQTQSCWRIYHYR